MGTRTPPYPTPNSGRSTSCRGLFLGSPFLWVNSSLQARRSWGLTWN